MNLMIRFVTAPFLMVLDYSHSIVATGLSEKSQRTLLMPGTSFMILSLILYKVLYGISDDLAVTASLVLIALITAAQPI